MQPRLTLHVGTLYEAPWLPPEADARARHVRDALIRYGYYRLPLWERERLGGSRSGEATRILLMMAARGLQDLPRGSYPRQEGVCDARLLGEPCRRAALAFLGVPAGLSTTGPRRRLFPRRPHGEIFAALGGEILGGLADILITRRGSDRPAFDRRRQSLHRLSRKVHDITGRRADIGLLNVHRGASQPGRGPRKNSPARIRSFAVDAGSSRICSPIAIFPGSRVAR